MEQTLGNRIVFHRKRLGLTQDQLAEKLGVTAQAVSKWENDQSCPDITMLPKLAQLFSISIDALLGHEQEEKVHTAEVVDEHDHDDDENDGIHIHNGNWEFKWDSSRKDALTFAILILLVGAIMLCSRILHLGADFWSILWPSAFLVYGVRGLFRRFSFFRAGWALLGAYYLVENLNIWQMELAGELVFPAIILLLGLSLLVDAIHKPKKPRFSVHHNGVEVHPRNDRKHSKDAYTEAEDSFNYELHFGENTRYVTLPRLREGNISVSFGELTVDLSGCEELSEDCQINANCCFGQLNLLVPAKYRVDTASSTAFASFDQKGKPDEYPQGSIHLDANASFGEILVKYV